MGHCCSRISALLWSLTRYCFQLGHSKHYSNGFTLLRALSHSFASRQDGFQTVLDLDPNDNDVPGTGSSCLLTTGYELGFSKNENDVITGCILHTSSRNSENNLLCVVVVAALHCPLPTLHLHTSVQEIHIINSSIINRPSVHIYIFSSLPSVQYEKRGETIVHATNYGY